MKKKLTALFLALVMCASLCVPAFAASSSDAVAEQEEEFDRLTTLLMEAELSGDSAAAKKIQEQMADTDIEVLTSEDLLEFLGQTDTPVPYILLPETTDDVTWTKTRYSSYEASNTGCYKVIHLRATPRNTSSRLMLAESVNIENSDRNSFTVAEELTANFVLAAAGTSQHVSPILTVADLLSEINRTLSTITKLEFNSLTLYYSMKQICDYYYVMSADVSGEAYAITLKKNRALVDYSYAYGGATWNGTDENPFNGAGELDEEVEYAPSPNGDMDTACVLFEQNRTRSDLIGDIDLELVESYEYTIPVEFPPDPFAVW